MRYGYARVSTYSQAKDGNSLEGQKKLLMENGCLEENIVADFFTGTKALNERKEFEALVEKMQEGDVLVVTKLDRFARNVRHGIEIIDMLLEKGVAVNVLNLGVMDNTPTGKLIRTIFLAFAEFERDMIVERTKEGKAIAKQNGDFKEGRPRTYDDKRMAHAANLLKSGFSYSQVASMTGISKATLSRRIKELRDQNKY